jgi:iron complex transport system substrate-binding protein
MTAGLKADSRGVRQRRWLRTIIVLVVWAMARVPPGSHGAAASGFGLLPDGSVRDAAGRVIAVKRPFARIISLYGAHTENLLALGLDAQIIGVSRTESAAPQAANKPAFSYHEDPEKILAAKPDLVLVRPMVERGYARLLERLADSGVTVASFQPATVDQMYIYWQALGRLTGKSDQAACLKAAFKTALDGFALLRSRIQTPKYVFFEAIHSKMKTFTPQAMPAFALAQAGGLNIAADARQVRDTNIAFYGREQILARASQIDVYLAQTGAMNPVTVETIKNEPGFKAIKAVRDNHVHTIDEALVSRPTPRLLDGIFQIGTIVYPNIFNEAARRRLNLNIHCRQTQ